MAPTQALRFRFPWLLSTIASGTLCALLVSVFEKTRASAVRDRSKGKDDGTVGE
jgi:magnesium transporter